MVATRARDCLTSPIFQSLRHRNFRIYFGAQLISTSGTWVQLLAENWLVVRLTHSGLALGVATALQFTPLLLFGAYGGVLVDRMEKRSLLVATQSAAGLLALITGLLVATGLIRIWMVWLAALLLGVVNALDNPGRQAFTMEMVGPDDVTNAVGLINAVATSARAVGPVVGGLLIAAAGLTPAFLINAGSYLVVVAALLAVHTSELRAEVRPPRLPGQVREGLRYVWNTPALRVVLLILAVVATFGFNFQVLLPLLASQTYHQGAAAYGWLMSSMGVGAVMGSLLVASWNPPTVRRVGLLALVFAGGFVGVGLAPVLAAALPAAGLMGLTSSLFLASCASSLQLNAGEMMRGRVMALYSIAFLGTAPIGGPVIGYLAQALGPRAGFLLGAALSAVAGVLGLAGWALRSGGETDPGA